MVCAKGSLLVWAPLMFLLLLGCDDDEGGQCMCISSNQYPVYLGCEMLFTSSDVYDCSRNALLNQVYSATMYPEEARQDSVEGRVILKFEIGTDGHLSGYRATTQIGHGLEEAAISGAMTLDSLGFCPARKGCQPIEFTFTLPVSFILPG